MPLYDSSPRWHRKARRINAYILEVGNFGHNRASSYTHRTTCLIGNGSDSSWKDTMAFYDENGNEIKRVTSDANGWKKKKQVMCEKTCLFKKC